MYSPISVSRGNDSVEFVPFGGTVTSWKVDGDEILFMSEKSLSDGKTPIRGGIPLVFPNFGAWELGPHHGFAHTKEWTIKEGPLEVENGDKTILWSLQDDESTRSIWKHRFEVLYRVTLRKAQLDLELSVENKGEDAFDFTALLHPFWRMKDVRQSKLSGCRDVIYSDKTKDFSERREEREYVTVTEWTDNIYKSTASVHTLTGVGSGKTLTIEKKKNLPDTAVTCSFAQQRQVQVTLSEGRDVRVANQVSGYVLTPGFTTGQPVPHNFRGAVTLQAPLGFSRIRLDFEEFDLQTSAQCSADLLVVRTANVAPRFYCSNGRPKPYLSNSPVVNLMLLTNGLRHSRGFRIRFTATNSKDICGDRSQFQCGSLECIPLAQVCDGRFDCGDGTDEEFCHVPLYRPNLVTDVPCGSPVVEPATENGDRIVGGREAVPHSWPWQPSIQLSGTFPAAHFCGGALLRNDLLITAAHCVAGKRPEELVVKFGSHNIIEDEAGIQIRSVDIIARHNWYLGGRNMTNDVAVLKLTLPVNFTDHVRPVCLPGPGETLPSGTTCYTTGWGTTRGTGGSFLLKQTRLTVRDFDQSCSNILSFQPTLRGSEMVCATDDEDSSGPCHGDSGGPLVCQIGSSSDWTLAGMTSQGTHLTSTHALCGMGTGTIWSSTIANRAWIDGALRRF